MAKDEEDLVFGPRGKAFRWSSRAIGLWAIFWYGIALWQMIVN